ncbi:hypothetical protein EUGRSUZ_K03564 [Eucalyptus grandis]|uniref:Uncharacterized protein n=2 Tax=Eucalyptus grandis TaxID=71139 RepID=A0ACC3J1P6_EUCGR|nr:hypothetical protein EUGRSUZ_K03564 [Eucalyptus grandis]
MTRCKDATSILALRGFMITDGPVASVVAPLIPLELIELDRRNTRGDTRGFMSLNLSRKIADKPESLSQISHSKSTISILQFPLCMVWKHWFKSATTST